MPTVTEQAMDSSCRWRSSGLRSAATAGSTWTIESGRQRIRPSSWLPVAESSALKSGQAAAADTLVVADGFSCREQIEQGTGRGTLQLAEALARTVRN
jgi:hypothetical protein